MTEELKLSYSKIKNWRFCRMSYYYSNIERIEPKKKPRPLELGSAVHGMIEDYRLGKNWLDRLKGIKETYDKLSLDEKEHYGNIPLDSEKIVAGYLQHYKEEDKGLVYHLIEKELGPFELVEGVVFGVKPDGLAEDTMGRMLLVEMKTGKRLPPEDFRLWNLQTLLYVWGVRQGGYKVDGVLWDHIRTKIPTEPRLLKDGTMSRRELDTTYETYYNALIKEGLNPDDYTGVLDLLKKRKAFYARYKLPVKESMMQHIMKDARITAAEIRDGLTHITRDVSQMKCPRCMYRPLCEAALLEGDEAYVKAHEFVAKRKQEEPKEKEEDEEE